MHSGSALVAACRAAPSALFYPYLRLATLVSSWFDLSNVRYIRYECCPLVRLSWNETDPHFLTGTNIAVYTAETLESISEKKSQRLRLRDDPDNKLSENPFMGTMSNEILRHKASFFFTPASQRVSAVFAVATCLSACLTGTRR